MPTVQGHRRDDAEPAFYKPGDYGQFKEHWYGMTPNGLLGNLDAHERTVHEDSSVSFAPSILVTGVPEEVFRTWKTGEPWPPTTRWHGYLERGIWRQLPE